MQCGMSDDMLIYLITIAASLIIGFMIGTISCIIITAREIKALQDKLDKVNTLYSKELNKWKNKYNNDDYEAY